jgi:cyclopropane-fatty-acyl-phospholipid synthase
MHKHFITGESVFSSAGIEVLALGFDENFIRMWDFYLCYCEGTLKKA